MKYFISSFVFTIIFVKLETAKNTDSLPAQIIQTTNTSMSQESVQYMPSKNALRKRIKRARNSDVPTEPNSLQELIIPESFRVTLSGEQFLVRESEVGRSIHILCIHH